MSEGGMGCSLLKSERKKVKVKENLIRDALTFSNGRRQVSEGGMGCSRLKSATPRFHCSALHTTSDPQVFKVKVKMKGKEKVYIY